MGNHEQRGRRGAHLQIHPLNQLAFAESTRQVLLVAQHQQRDARQRVVLALLWFQQIVQLVARQIDGAMISSVHDEYDGVHASAVSLPHAPEARLATQIPQLRE